MPSVFIQDLGSSFPSLLSAFSDRLLISSSFSCTCEFYLASLLYHILLPSLGQTYCSMVFFFAVCRLMVSCCFWCLLLPGEKLRLVQRLVYSPLTGALTGVVVMDLLDIEWSLPSALRLPCQTMLLVVGVESPKSIS